MPAPQRPGAVAQESPASGLLHILETELLAAKAAWEQLGVRIAKGYTLAYGEHERTLLAMKKANEAKASDNALLFVLSVVSVGYAGGLVGGLITPWVQNAGAAAAERAIRSAVSGVAQEAAKRVVKAGIETVDSGRGTGDPYVPVSPKEILVDQEIRDRIGSAFGPILEALDAMIAEANRLQANAAVGQSILNDFRQNCPLLTDKPAQADIPSESAAKRAAELPIWVAWAIERNWEWWDKQYKWLDPSLWAEVRRTGSTDDFNALETHFWVSRDKALEIDPVGRRMMDLGKWGDTRNSAEPYWDRANGSFIYTDLRKLRALRVEDVDLPFRKLSRLGLQWDKTKPLDRVKFLSKLGDVRPAFK